MSTLSAAVQVCDRAILHTARARFAGSVCDRAILHTARARFAGGHGSPVRCAIGQFRTPQGQSESKWGSSVPSRRRSLENVDRVSQSLDMDF